MASIGMVKLWLWERCFPSEYMARCRGTRVIEAWPARHCCLVLIDGGGRRQGRVRAIGVEGLATAFERRPASVVGNFRNGYAPAPRIFLASDFHFLALTLGAQLLFGLLRFPVRSPMTSTPVRGMSLFKCFPYFSNHCHSVHSIIYCNIFEFGRPRGTSIQFPFSSCL